VVLLLITRIPNSPRNSLNRPTDLQLSDEDIFYLTTTE
jgi:hypothetical protein